MANETRRIEKIMLAIPNGDWAGPRHWNMHPYPLCLLAAILRDRYDVRILDSNIDNMSAEETAERIAEYSPDVLGITCLSIEFARSAHQFAEIARKAAPEAIVVMGGVYPTVQP